jgi:hypothetical protein
VPVRKDAHFPTIYLSMVFLLSALLEDRATELPVTAN